MGAEARIDVNLSILVNEPDTSRPSHLASHYMSSAAGTKEVKVEDVPCHWVFYGSI